MENDDLSTCLEVIIQIQNHLIKKFSLFYTTNSHANIQSIRELALSMEMTESGSTSY